MSALPERYQRYAQPGQQPVQPREIELYDEADPIVLVADPYDPSNFVAVRRSALQPVQPTAPRDLAPQPLFDPQAQIIFAKGAGAGTAAAGIGWGIGQAAAGVAAIGGTTAVVAMLALWLLSRLGGRGGTYIHKEQHTHVQQKWFGRTNVSNQQ